MQQCLSNPDQFRHDTLEDIVSKEVPAYCKEAAQAYSEYQRAGCPDPGRALEQAAAKNGMLPPELFSLCGW